MRFRRVLGAVERRLLGAVMNAIALLLDRQLRGLQSRAADKSNEGVKTSVET